jgi:hypothetical protein
MSETSQQTNADDAAKLQNKIIREVHNSLVVNMVNSETYVIAVAVCKDGTKNFINRISCKKGIPIEGYIYDAQSDCYFIECSDYLHIGNISVSFVASSKSRNCWKINVPLPENVIKKYLSETQKKDLKNFKAHFNNDEYTINYIQMVAPN